MLRTGCHVGTMHYGILEYQKWSNIVQRGISMLTYQLVLFHGSRPGFLRCHLPLCDGRLPNTDVTYHQTYHTRDRERRAASRLHLFISARNVNMLKF